MSHPSTLAALLMGAILISPAVVHAQDAQVAADAPGDAKMNCGAIASEAERLRELVPPEIANAPQPTRKIDYTGKSAQEILAAMRAPKPVTNAGKYNARLTRLNAMFSAKDCSGGGG